jgi:hypothetical protein
MKALVPKARKNEQPRTHTVILNLVQNLKNKSDPETSSG